MFQLIGDLFNAMFNVLGGIAALILLVVGILTLFYGRRLFWVFAALIGFIFGLMIASQLTPDMADFIRILIAIGVGTLCGIMTVYAEKLMIILVGFLGFGISGYLLISLFDFSSLVNWIIFLISGSIGAVYITRHIEWVVIIVSALLGSLMVSIGVSKFVHTNFLIDLLVFIALLSVGIFFQKKVLSGKN